MSELTIVAGDNGFSNFFCLRIRIVSALTHSDKAAAAKAGHGPHGAQEIHAGGYRAAKAAKHESYRGYEEAHAPPEYVGEAAIQRLERRAGNEVRGGQPRGVVGCAEVGADQRVCGCGDGTVEAGQKDIGPERF